MYIAITAGIIGVLVGLLIGTFISQFTTVDAADLLESFRAELAATETRLILETGKQAKSLAIAVEQVRVGVPQDVVFQLNAASEEAIKKMRAAVETMRLVPVPDPVSSPKPAKKSGRK